MLLGTGIPVQEAAARLHVRPERILAMIRAGLLDARKIGGRWLVDPGSLDRRRGSAVPAGRQFSPTNAWAILLLAARTDGAERYLEHLTAPARSRARAWLRGASLLDLAPRLRGRARTLRLRVHPSDLSRLSAEPGLVLAGVSAAAEHRLDITAPGILELYVPARILRQLTKKYTMEPSADPNVILRAVNAEWPFRQTQRVAPAAIAALDLLEGDDERTHRAGREYLQGLPRP